MRTEGPGNSTPDRGGGHVCMLCGPRDPELTPGLLELLRGALGAGEQVILVSGSSRGADLLDRLEVLGVDVPEERRCGRLVLKCGPEGPHTARLGTTLQAADIRALVANGLAAGYWAVRIVVDIAGFFGPDVPGAEVDRWEAAVNEILMPGFPGSVVCLYDGHRLPSELLELALHTHPVVLSNGEAAPNPFCRSRRIPASRPTSGPADPVGDMLRQMRSAAAVTRSLERLLREEGPELPRQAGDALVQVLKDSGDLDEAAPRILRAIVEMFQLGAGCLWRLRPERGDLQCLSTWSATGQEMDEFLRDLRRVPLSPGALVPPGAWSAVRPAWFSEATSLDEPPCVVRARQAGLRTFVAIPIPVEKDIGGVIGMFSREVRRPGEMIFRDLRQMASLVGQFLERKAAQASQRLLAAIVESCDDAVVSKDLDGIITSWNQGARNLFGYTASEAVGQSITMLIPPDREDEEPNILGRIRAGIRIDHYQTVRRHKNGSLLDVSLTVSPIKDANGRVVGASKIARDISESRRTQEALRQSEAKFRALADNISQFAWMADPSGWIFWYNQRWMEYTGTSLGEVEGWGWRKVHHPDHVQRVERKLRRHFEAGEIWEDTFPLRGKDGRYRWFLSRAVPLRDEQGRVTRWFGTNTDITEQLESEQAVAAHARRAEFLSNLAARLLRTKHPRRLLAPIFRQVARELKADIHVNYLYSKTGDLLELESASGLAEIELQGFRTRRIDEGLCGRAASLRTPVIIGDLQAMADEYAAKWRALGVRAFTCHPMQAGDRLLGTLAFASRLREAFDSGEVRFITTACDLVAATLERADLLEEVRAARDAAEQASRAKDDFMARLSHELRTPLNPVLLVATDAASRPDLPPGLRQDFHTIIRHTTLEARLIDDLLDLTRISRGKVALERRLLDAHALLRETLDIVRPELNQGGIELKVQLEAPSHKVQADTVRLQQVFWNVLRNAVKFTPHGGQVTVSTRCDPDQRTLTVCVADTGIGMIPRELNHIFDAFSQGEHAAAGGTAFGGLGLGLAISKTLIELHGGSIRALSRGRGKGSEFLIDVPLADVSVPAPPAEGTDDPRAAAPPQRQQSHPQTGITAASCWSRTMNRPAGRLPACWPGAVTRSTPPAASPRPVARRTVASSISWCVTSAFPMETDAISCANSRHAVPSGESR